MRDHRHAAGALSDGAVLRDALLRLRVVRVPQLPATDARLLRRAEHQLRPPAAALMAGAEAAGGDTDVAGPLWWLRLCGDDGYGHMCCNF